MILTLLTGILLGVPSAAQDTVVDLRSGDLLVLEGFSGSVSVETWNRGSMEVWADAGEDTRIQVRRQGRRLELQVSDEKGRDRELELHLTVPPWLNLDVSGRDLDVDVRDLSGDVRIKNLDGDLVLWNLSGVVEATSVQGEIEARGLHGSARLKTGDDDLEVDGVTGDLWIQTISGDVGLQNAVPRRLEVLTTSGDVDFQGRLSETGEYTLQSHDGNLSLTLEGPLNLDVSVLVYDGDFSSEFPVRARGYRSGEEFFFTLGEGGGRLRLETFDGDIKLRNRR